MKWVSIVILIFCFACSGNVKKADDTSASIKTDTMEIIRNFIYGLWSMDSGNSLNNEGFYFKPDGSVDFVAADYSGEWELSSKDSLKIIYSNFNEEKKSLLKIDSLNEDRMILTDSDGTYLFRKVPFGMNSEGTVMQGFSGRLEKGEDKEYEFNVPAAKKIELKLKCENSNVVFNVYDGKNIITPTPLRNWSTIMVRSGKYKVVISYPKVSTTKDAAEFDLKVVGY